MRDIVPASSRPYLVMLRNQILFPSIASYSLAQYCTVLDCPLGLCPATGLHAPALQLPPAEVASDELPFPLRIREL